MGWGGRGVNALNMSEYQVRRYIWKCDIVLLGLASCGELRQTLGFTALSAFPLASEQQHTSFPDPVPTMSIQYLHHLLHIPTGTARRSNS